MSERWLIALPHGGKRVDIRAKPINDYGMGSRFVCEVTTEDAERIVAALTAASDLASAQARVAALEAGIYQSWPAGGVICIVCQGWGSDRSMVIHQNCAFLHAYQDARKALAAGPERADRGARCPSCQRTLPEHALGCKERVAENCRGCGQRWVCSCTPETRRRLDEETLSQEHRP